jgi:Flp pilus assembly pilin Flp
MQYAVILQFVAVAAILVAEAVNTSLSNRKTRDFRPRAAR